MVVTLLARCVSLFPELTAPLSPLLLPGRAVLSALSSKPNLQQLLPTIIKRVFAIVSTK